MHRIGLAAIAASVIVGGVVATPAQAAATCFGERATIVGNERDNEINGTPGRDVIVAGGGSDVVHGQGGNDLICGGTGEDGGLYGDAGNDRIHAGKSERTSILYGGRGNDPLYDEPGGGDGQKMFGGPGDDFLKAGDSNGTYNDELDGGPGNDVMEQGEGEGLLYEGPGDDVIWGGRGSSNDQLILTDAPVGIAVNMARGTLRGWGGGKVGEIEVVMGSRFDDTITGDGDSNFLIGAGGDDVISGGSARDCLMGGAIDFFHRC
jgi:Ca2+-binding RTX toxin-like protein